MKILHFKTCAMQLNQHFEGNLCSLRFINTRYYNICLCEVCCIYVTYNACCMPNHLSHVQLFVTLWTVACQAPLSMGFSRQEYWSGLPCPSPGDLPDPGIERRLVCPLHWQAGSSLLVPPGSPLYYDIMYKM